MSQIAKSGYRAEDLLCVSTHALSALGSQYFGKKIVKCEKVPGHKKSDNILTFDDGSKTRAQLKNGTGGGRGWSFDRRSVDDIPGSDELKDLLKNVCLKAGGERKSVPLVKDIISKLLLGDDESTRPEHFIHTTIQDGQITSVTACSASVFVDTILKGAFENLNAKRTCVHFTPLIYLQRKGGGSKDHSPSDIQAKLRSMPDCMKVITLNQTTPLQ